MTSAFHLAPPVFLVLCMLLTFTLYHGMLGNLSNICAFSPVTKSESLLPKKSQRKIISLKKLCFLMPKMVG